jgi:hypothetical protein
LRRLIQHHVEVVGWRDDQADCVCPGDHHHGPGGAKYATVFLNGKWPVVHCFHQSCQQARAEVNAQLRTEVLHLLGEKGVKIKLTEGELEEQDLRKRCRAMEAGARHRLLSRIKKKPPIALADWRAASPVPVRDVPIKDHW